MLSIPGWSIAQYLSLSFLLNLGDIRSGWNRASSQKESLVFPLNRVLITEEHNLISTCTMDGSCGSQNYTEGKGVLQTYQSVFGLRIYPQMSSTKCHLSFLFLSNSIQARHYAQLRVQTRLCSWCSNESLWNLLRMVAPSPITTHRDGPEKSLLNHCFQYSFMH